MHNPKSFLICCLMAIVREPVGAQDGALDPSFGEGGIVVTDFGETVDRALGTAIQPDGRIIAVGMSGPSETEFSIAVARYLSDGSLDPDFGSEGKVISNLTANGDLARRVVIQPDGKFVVAGCAEHYSGPRFVVVRYMPDGTMDPEFNGTGWRITSFTGPSQVNGLALLPDGRILAIGSCASMPVNSFAAARYTTDGEPDPSFGIEGKVLTLVGTGTSVATGLALLPDGRFLICGYAMVTGEYQAVLVRYLPDGDLDDSFGTGGMVMTSLTDFHDVSMAVRPLSDERFLVVSGAGLNRSVSCFLENGTLDPGFGTGGVVLTDLGCAAGYLDIATQADGRILICSHTVVADIGRAAIARYMPDGTLDPSFGLNGLVTTGYALGNYANALAIQEEGMVVAVGEVNAGLPANIDFWLARYQTGLALGEGSPNGSFPELSVRPSPVEREAWIDLMLHGPCDLGVDVRDMAGRIVVSDVGRMLLNAGSYSIPVDMSGLVPGSYVITLRVSERAWNKRVMKL